MLPLVLASTSPFRREILTKLGLPFTSVAPNVDETSLPGEAAEQLVARLAEAKARAVAASHPNALIIGSDQVAVCQGEIVGKPGDFERARQQLQRLSGEVICFYTGLALCHSALSHCQVEVVPFKVHFRNLSNAQIERYLHTEKPFNCAGSFMSEGLGITLFSRLEGDDPNTLIGLPLIRLVAMLENEGITLP
ncbi:MAG: septum formation inhibitor Maf [Gammaproteobacteria bacterium]|nr:septum formation inhibitor Maf [Gammaproteobacteria bacterium]